MALAVWTNFVEKAHELKLPALAITDHGAMHGAVDFYKEAREKGRQAHHRLRGLCRAGVAAGKEIFHGRQGRLQPSRAAREGSGRLQESRQAHDRPRIWRVITTSRALTKKSCRECTRKG
jgi:hypothetical protein